MESPHTLPCPCVTDVYVIVEKSRERDSRRTHGPGVTGILMLGDIGDVKVGFHLITGNSGNANHFRTISKD